MSLTPEWRPRIEQWLQAMESRIFERVTAVPMSAAFTFEQLAPIWEPGGRAGFCDIRNRERRILLDFAPLKTGSAWGRRWEYAWLSAHVNVPSSEAGQTLVLKIGESGDQWANEESMGEWRVMINQREVGSRDWAHTWIPLAERAEVGMAFDFLAEAFGGPTRFGAGGGPAVWGAPEHIPERPQRHLPELTLGRWREDVYQLSMDVRTLLELRDTLDQRSLRVDEIDAGLRDFTLIADPELPWEMFAPTVIAARERLRPLLECKNGTTAPVLHGVGHSHLDVVYQWPLAETERKVARTFSNQLALLDRYPEYRFLQSMPVLYETAKHLYPELYERVQMAVRAGGWIPEGGMWTEADTNLPNGESLIRQLMHGRRFFREEFGVESVFAWLPDVFGYSGALPQILVGCGMQYFASAKIYGLYNGGEKFPYTSFWWEGIDGTRILSHCPDGYGSHTNPKSLADIWNNRPEQSGVRSRLVPYGHSDGGGGCVRDHLEFLRRSKDLEGLPRTVHSSPADFFSELKSDAEHLPIYVGEIYFALHRGTYTTQAVLKAGNRRCEIALRDAEFFSCAATLLSGLPYPWDALDSAWKKLLFNQFHDILPGSCIERAAEEARDLYGQVLEATHRITASALAALPKGKTHGHRAFNTLGWRRSELVCCPENTEGAQVIEGKSFIDVDFPACGWSALIPSASTGEVHATPRSLENSFVRVELDDFGQITRCFDKLAQRDIGSGIMNGFEMFRDTPRVCDAWDIDSHFALQPVPLTAPARIEVVASGPLVAILRIHRVLNHSLMTQEIRLRRNSRRVDFFTRINWQEKHKLLKVAFPVSIHAQEALHEIQFGHVRRPTHRSRPLDADRYEVCQQKWSALTEETCGVALLNDSKYGIDVLGNRMRLTLLRAPLAPDPHADLGVHTFTYSLYFWNGPFAKSGVIREAWTLNTPPHVVAPDVTPAPITDIPWPDSTELFYTDQETIVLDTIKLAEDRSGDVILRLFESMGTHTRCCLHSHSAILEGFETDMLENIRECIPCDGSSIPLTLRPFEIKTLRLRLQKHINGSPTR